MADTALLNEKEIFTNLLSNVRLRNLRAGFDVLLGHPVWWISSKLNGNHKSFQRHIESSYEIWRDPRVKHFKKAEEIYRTLKKKVREPRPMLFYTSDNRSHFCIPLMAGNKVIAIFGVSGLKSGVSQDILNLLSGYVQVIVESCAKDEELGRLSATIRPRAIALSTVHTVHRIINSTLNLDELISRLTYLTMQVLRASRCAIYLVDKDSKKQQLVCKAIVGYPKHLTKGFKIHWGGGLEGKVAKTALAVLRKRVLSLPLIDEDVIGVVTVQDKKDKTDFTYSDQEILSTLAEEAVIAIKNAQLYEDQKRVTLGTVQSLAVILGTRLPHAHSQQAMLHLALKIAEEIKLNEEETQALHYATLLKDTAKIGIPDEILKKQTKLTGEEYQLLREHPIKGARIVESFETLKSAVPMILYSREKYDGTGYPKGLKGEKIPVGARILSVLNAFEAITTGRPYRDRSSLKEALDEIKRNSGTQFDPKIVQAFLTVIQKYGLHHFIKNAR